MTTTPEGRVAAALRKAAIERGFEIRKLKWEGRNGAPDYFLAKDGLIVLVECKQPGSRPRKSQMTEFDRLSQAGVCVLVLDRADDAEDLTSLIGWFVGDYALVPVKKRFGYERFKS